MANKAAELKDWLHCPNCRQTDVRVTEQIGDRGGIESRNFECANCGASIRVIA